jgi:glutamate-5-semialdehyde dehydrogenase
VSETNDNIISAQLKFQKLEFPPHNQILSSVAVLLRENCALILENNALDMHAAKKNGLKDSLLDRLSLSKERIEQIACSVEDIVKLPNPLGILQEKRILPNEIELHRVSVPLGIIGVIYEARPNVTIDIAALAIKSGNGVVLRGSKSAHNSNKVLVDLLQQACSMHNVPKALVTQFTDYSENGTLHFLSSDSPLTVVIPRGGGNLIRFVRENAKIPYIETGEGNCHIFVDESAEYEKAESIVCNAKTSRPSVCNTMETLLIHKDWPTKHQVALLKKLQAQGVTLFGCATTQQLLPNIQEVTTEHFETEFNDLILAVKVVPSIEQALIHIDQFTTNHSEAIITTNHDHSKKFLREVDAAVVYVNASTRFTDGGEFGFGAEVGISTQKLHVRGPMGLSSLTSYKYLAHGTGQVRVR